MRPHPRPATDRPRARMTDFAGQQFLFHPDRALVWPARRTAVVADVHFGKASLFRAAGVPVPAGTTSHDLARLSAIVEQTAAKRLLILGDLLHGREGRADSTFSAVEAWRGRHADLSITLVRGNHDRHAGDPPEAWRVEVVDGPLVEADIAFQHEPPEGTAAGMPTVCGHVHPTARLEDFDGAAASAACFVVDAASKTMILPAFGRFTGGCRMPAAPGRRFFVPTGERVVEVPC